MFPTDALRRDKPRKRENPLATALKLQALLDTGVYATRSELAAGLGLSRARVTQLLNLLRLPKGIMDRLVDLVETPSSGVTITERQLRRFVRRGATEEDLADLNQAIGALGSRAGLPDSDRTPIVEE